MRAWAIEPGLSDPDSKVSQSPKPEIERLKSVDQRITLSGRVSVTRQVWLGSSRLRGLGGEGHK
jgi:hypothetical protein